MPKASETVAAIINASTDGANDILMIMRASERLEILTPLIEDLVDRGHQHKEIAETLRYLATELTILTIRAPRTTTHAGTAGQ